MPKSAMAAMFFILVGGVVGLLFTPKLLQVQHSWLTAVNKVKESNEKQAPQLDAESQNLFELQSSLANQNLGWDKLWNGVQTTPNANNGSLNVTIGSNQGLVEGMTLHAFQPIGQEYIYVGPFKATTGNVRNDSATLINAWKVIQFVNPGEPVSFETSTWGGPAQWRFRSVIPAANKVAFDGAVARYQTNLQQLTDTARDIAKQDRLKQEAQEQLDRREGELIGIDDPNAQEDPLRPELTKGLVAAIEDEEEARNILQLDIDELRNGILDVKEDITQLEAQLSGPSGAKDRPARIGSRPR